MNVGIEARVGAKWWADKIRDGFWPDNGAGPGAGYGQGGTDLIAMNRKVAMEGVTMEMVQVYEDELALEIQLMLDRGDSSYLTAMALGCDYGPGPAHHVALEKAEIKPLSTVLPWKTMMWVERGRVSVSNGYRAEPVELPLEVEDEAG